MMMTAMVVKFCGFGIGFLRRRRIIKGEGELSCLSKGPNIAVFSQDLGEVVGWIKIFKYWPTLQDEDKGFDRGVNIQPRPYRRTLTLGIGIHKPRAEG